MNLATFALVRTRTWMISGFAIVLAMILAQSSCFAGEQDAQIVAATRAYVAKELATLPGIVKVEKVEGSFALAQVLPKNPAEADAAWVFLKRDRGRWRVLTLGTGFSPEDYKELGIPKGVQL